MSSATSALVVYLILHSGHLSFADTYFMDNLMCLKLMDIFLPLRSSDLWNQVSSEDKAKCVKREDGEFWYGIIIIV